MDHEVLVLYPSVRWPYHSRLPNNHNNGRCIVLKLAKEHKTEDDGEYFQILGDPVRFSDLLESRRRRRKIRFYNGIADMCASGIFASCSFSLQALQQQDRFRADNFELGAVCFYERLKP
jgi:hypothetical protein